MDASLTLVRPLNLAIFLHKDHPVALFLPCISLPDTFFFTSISHHVALPILLYKRDITCYIFKSKVLGAGSTCAYGSLIKRASDRAWTGVGRAAGAGDDDRR